MFIYSIHKNKVINLIIDIMTKFIKFILIIVAFICLSCEKESNHENIIGTSNLNNEYRISEITEYYFDIDQWFINKKDVIKYDADNRVISIKTFYFINDEWEENEKTEIGYNGNLATVTNYVIESNTQLFDTKFEFLLQNNQLVEEIMYSYSNNSWIKYWNWKYKYEGSSLISWNGIYFEDSIEYKGEYNYSNNQPVESLTSFRIKPEPWELFYKQIFHYNNNLISGFTFYTMDLNDEWEEREKCDYEYTENKIVKSNYQFLNYETSIWESTSENFAYDNNNCLVEYIYETNIKKTYTYENGTGNAQLFYYYPDEMISGSPVLKNKSVNNKYIPYYKRWLNKLN